MIFYFDENGKNLSVENEKVYQGSDNKTEIYFASPLPSDSVVGAAFSLPDGSTTAKRPMTNVTFEGQIPEGLEDISFNFWKYSLPVSITKDFGVITVQFFAVTGSDEITSTASGKFTVERGVKPNNQDSEDTYTDFIEVLYDVNDRLDDLSDVVDGINLPSLSVGTGNKSVQAEDCNASGDYSVALNKGTVASCEGQTVVGRFNSTDSTALFIVGGGNSFLRKNAFTVTSDGRATVGASPTQGMDVANKFYVDEKVSTAISSVMTYKGSVLNYSNLPQSGNKTGDVYNVVLSHGNTPPGTNYAWNGSNWDSLGGSVDLSAFALDENIPTVTFLGE